MRARACVQGRQTPFPTTSLYFRCSPAAGSLGFRVRAWLCVRGSGGGGGGGEGHGLRAWTFRGRRPTGVAPPFGRSWLAKCECGRGRGPGGRTFAAGRVRPGWTPSRPWRESAGSAGRRERAGILLPSLWPVWGGRDCWLVFLGSNSANPVTLASESSS